MMNLMTEILSKETYVLVLPAYVYWYEPGNHPYDSLLWLLINNTQSRKDEDGFQNY